MIPNENFPKQLTDLEARGIRRGERDEITGSELINKFKRRLDSGNYEGRDGPERCSVEIEEKDESYDIVVKTGSASSETRWITQDNLQIFKDTIYLIMILQFAIFRHHCIRMS